jgi:hypothetical protein
VIANGPAEHISERTLTGEDIPLLLGWPYIHFNGGSLFFFFLQVNVFI